MNETTRGTLLPLLFSIIVAAVVLVLAVLPAEFGVDPTGFGRASGLMALSNEEMETTNYNEAGEADIRSDRQVWTIAPYENFEYKYHLLEGQSLLFDWSATAEVEYDFHTDAMIDGEEVSDSFAISAGTGARGSYVAPYDGIHGIFFENRGADDVEITLLTYGFYDEATLFRDGGVYEDQINGEGTE
ncbi:hypothetical protein [Ponticaulis koreensis]|uniref:hypothetical protein n=1 Tax=Ponticaulis koreensis TaxID=1123045 RepID=UPI0003B5CD3D|nr:hypothetical protein [Ponticaulis koreensis]